MPFPDIPIGFAEFTSRTTGWAHWVADSLAWCETIGADPAVLFTSLGRWRTTPTQLADLAALLTPDAGAASPIAAAP